MEVSGTGKTIEGLLMRKTGTQGAVTMSELKELFERRAKKLGLRESSFQDRYHNGKVAIELDQRNERLIIVSWENGSGFDKKRFRCGNSVDEWLDRSFDFAECKALESAQESLELQQKRVKHRVRRGQV